MNRRFSSSEAIASFSRMHFRSDDPWKGLCGLERELQQATLQLAKVVNEVRWTARRGGSTARPLPPTELEEQLHDAAVQLFIGIAPLPIADETGGQTGEGRGGARSRASSSWVDITATYAEEGMDGGMGGAVSFTPADIADAVRCCDELLQGKAFGAVLHLSAQQLDRAMLVAEVKVGAGGGGGGVCLRLSPRVSPP